MSETPKMRMNAYYYGFAPTGVIEIDRILSAVAHAGKAFHHTDSWCDSECGPREGLRGDSPVEWIQNAANDAAMLRQAATDAEALAAKDKEIARLTEHNGDCRCDFGSGAHVDWAFHTLCSLRREVKNERDQHRETEAKLDVVDAALTAERQKVREWIKRMRSAVDADNLDWAADVVGEMERGLTGDATEGQG